GVVIGPQRQTVLLAKQAAEVDVLTNGRFRLGIGTGWNAVEYEALGEDFGVRGRREEEQIALLRRLWTERSLSHDGVFDRVTGAGIAPLPVQRPIPVWLGGRAPAVPAARPGRGAHGGEAHGRGGRACGRARSRGDRHGGTRDLVLRR